MLPNAFGHFTDAGRSFTITDHDTPMPWVNVISTGRFGLVISQHGGGFSFFDDAQHNVLTRWEMDLVRDTSGKFLYLADLGSPSGDAAGANLWSLAPAPCRAKYDSFSCTHTLGSTTFKTARGGIEAEWTIAAAPMEEGTQAKGEPIRIGSPGGGVELWLVTIRNTSAAPRTLRLGSYLEWCCGVAPDTKREFHRLFLETTHDAGRNAIFATKNMWDIPPKSEKDHWNQPWPYVAAHAVCGDIAGSNIKAIRATGDKTTFLGRYGSPAAPKFMTAAGSSEAASGPFGRFGDAVAAHGVDFTLAPGETLKVHFLLAIGNSTAHTQMLLDTYRTREAAEKALAQVKEMWASLTSTKVSTGRQDFDLLNNHWLPYQAISGRVWGRTGYYQQSGAFGFRDQLQDSQVWLPIDPKRTRDQILLHATRQFLDGSVNHWWHALADFGNHTQCSDDYLWLPFLTANYIRETGDLAILHKTAPFRDSAEETTLLDHCRRSLRRAFERTSPRGLPFIGSCDWNDGLSAMGVDERGESVWLGMFLKHVLDEWVILSERLNDASTADDYRARAAALTSAINAHAWDGSWYRYGTKDSGEWVGSSQSPEGKIHLNAQTWSIIAGVAPSDRAATAWNSVKQQLLSDFGPLLLAPAYTTPDPTIGYVTRYCPGARENGGVYMHAATWALLTACKLRDPATVGKIFASISPPTRGQNAEAYVAEPYVLPGNVDGPLSDKPGRAGWTWYSGSAAWLNRVCLEWVLGIRPVWLHESGSASSAKAGISEGLLIDPCPPADLGRVDVSRRWRGHTVRLRFDAAAFAADKQATLKVNGAAFSAVHADLPCLPASLASSLPAGSTIDVEVTWETPRTTSATASNSARHSAHINGTSVHASSPAHSASHPVSTTRPTLGSLDDVSTPKPAVGSPVGNAVGSHGGASVGALKQPRE